MERAVLMVSMDGRAAAARKDMRLRAIYRRELQESVRASALLYAAIEVCVTLLFCLAQPGAAVLAVGVGAPLTAASLIVDLAVRRRGRRYAELLAMLLGLLPVVACLAALLALESFAPLVLSAYAMIPIAFTVFMPVDRRRHILWLALAGLVFLGPLTAFAAGSVRSALPAIVAGSLMSAVVSLVAHEVQAERRAQMERQFLAARGLYRRMQEHELDLRRQDEFLLMQQETLVVQQAELLRLNEELETIARLDALTGLGNRLRLNEDLVQLAGRIERSGGTAGLLLLDLDRFKRLNDSAGHLAGDAALRGVADVLRRTSRVGDGLYRYGGEEFLVVLHDCDENVLELAGQRYISAIQAAAMPHPDNAPWCVVTASAGAAELSQRNGVDVDAALRSADEALYDAKARGRNRLEVQVRRHTIVPLDEERAAS